MRKNQYPENPYPPGTMLAAHWDLHHSVSLLRSTTVAEVQRGWAKLARVGKSARDFRKPR